MTGLKGRGSRHALPGRLQFCSPQVNADGRSDGVVGCAEKKGYRRTSRCWRVAACLVLSAFIGVHRRPMFVFDDARWAGQKKHIWPPMNADERR
jgi:hypothetical protein